MKNIIILIGLIFQLFISNSIASDLPNCPLALFTWDNCYGSAEADGGGVYEGEWQNDRYNGQGVYTFPDGSLYYGNFKDNYFSGQGTFYWPDGDSYVGEFKYDKFNGIGTLTWADGSQQEGLWSNGEFVQSNKKLTWKDSGYWDEEVQPGVNRMMALGLLLERIGNNNRSTYRQAGCRYNPDTGDYRVCTFLNPMADYGCSFYTFQKC
mgnify:FL=1